MIIAAVLIGYLLFAIAIGKLLSYAALQDEVWSDIRENVIRPVPVPGTERADARDAVPRSIPGDRAPARSATPDRVLQKSIAP